MSFTFGDGPNQPTTFSSSWCCKSMGSKCDCQRIPHCSLRATHSRLCSIWKDEVRIQALQDSLHSYYIHQQISQEQTCLWCSFIVAVLRMGMHGVRTAVPFHGQQISDPVRSLLMKLGLRCVCWTWAGMRQSSCLLSTVFLLSPVPCEPKCDRYWTMLFQTAELHPRNPWW